MPVRRKLTDEEKALMRELHAQGNKFVYIAHVTGRSESVVHRAVRGYRGRW
jgi:IS30 family transposase